MLKINEPLVTDIGEPVDNVVGQANEHVRDIDWDALKEKHVLQLYNFLYHI